jgi:hypothetical protein
MIVLAQLLPYAGFRETRKSEENDLRAPNSISFHTSLRKRTAFAGLGNPIKADLDGCGASTVCVRGHSISESHSGILGHVM